MLRLNPDQLRQPHGGHNFLIPNGPAVKGESLKEVVQKVVDYRINNNIPLGDPEQEVLYYYALHWPYMVEPVEPKRIPAASSRFGGWSKWIRKSWINPPKKIITTKEAVGRWEVCATCPHNKRFDWKETNETAALTQRAFLLRRGIDAPKDLGYCDLHMADLSVLTFLETPESFSEKSKDKEQPPKCWV